MINPVLTDYPIPYLALAEQGCVQSRFCMTQFPIFADFEPMTTLGTSKVFYKLVVRARAIQIPEDHTHRNPK